MKINLEILNSAYIYAPTQIEDLNTKELVPKMVTRRRLTRSAKIAIFLTSQMNANENRIIYGNNYGELNSTANILNSINSKEAISPTIFQNSVHNTAVSYLSMLTSNKNEIITISSGDETSLKVLKVGAIKALDKDTILLIVTETLNIDKIEELNTCINYLECGVALEVKITNLEKTIDFMDIANKEKFPLSIVHMLNIAKEFDKTKKNIIEVTL